jgi:hypothetical protein
MIPWLLPYVGIWGAVAVAVGNMDMNAACTGFCAVNAGIETYLVLLGAALLSAAVASAELFLGRPHANR